MLFALPLPGSAAPSLLVIETGASVIALAFAFCWPRAGGSQLAYAERLLGHLAHRPRLSILVVGSGALLMRLSMLPLAPVPQPFIHDEFSFLLAGDTFAAGRLTNPTHPMWQHIESFHITQKPSYMSMYFPAQGLVLAAGKEIAGNPWYGVCASAALMCSAICWMLQGWLPPGWALLGGALAVFRLALFSYWVNGYYGGAVAAIGGSLVLGAFPRVIRKAHATDSFLMALGISLLANSRPYEGVLLCAPVLCALVWWLAAKEHPPVFELLRRATAGFTLLALTAGCMAYYNYRVFGDPFTLPYQVNRATYASAPVFLWETPRKEPVYRHRVMGSYPQMGVERLPVCKDAGRFHREDDAKGGYRRLFLCGTALFAPLCHAAPGGARPPVAFSGCDGRRVCRGSLHERLAVGPLPRTFHGRLVRPAPAVNAAFTCMAAGQATLWTGVGADTADTLCCVGRG